MYLGGGKDNWFVLGKSDTVAVVIYLVTLSLYANPVSLPF